MYGEWPKEHEEQQKLLFAGLAGIDLQHFPRYYGGRNAWVAVLIDRLSAQPVKMLLAEQL